MKILLKTFSTVDYNGVRLHVDTYYLPTSEALSRYVFFNSKNLRNIPIIQD